MFSLNPLLYTLSLYTCSIAHSDPLHLSIVSSSIFSYSYHVALALPNGTQYTLFVSLSRYESVESFREN